MRLHATAAIPPACPVADVHFDAEPRINMVQLSEQHIHRSTFTNHDFEFTSPLTDHLCSNARQEVQVDTQLSVNIEVFSVRHCYCTSSILGVSQSSNPCPPVGRGRLDEAATSDIKVHKAFVLRLGAGLGTLVDSE